MENKEIIELRRYVETDDTSWDDYVSRSKEGMFFHLSGWKKVLGKTYGYLPYFIYAERDRKICGVLPLFLMRSFLSGKAMVSLPFCVYGGICADDEEVQNKLFDEAKSLTRKLRANYLELRHKTRTSLRLPATDIYYTFIKELPNEKKRCLDTLPRKARAAARKGIEYGLEFHSGCELIKEFFDIYAVSVRNLGSPVFPFRYLENIVKEFPENTDVFLVRHKGKGIAGVFTFFYKGTVMPYYAGSLPEHFAMQPNNFMYLKLMEYGVEHGYRYFDFGRSKFDTGAYRFKEFNGFTAQPLNYQYYLNGLESPPNTTSANPKLKLAIELWKKTPLLITNFIGSRMIKFTPP